MTMMVQIRRVVEALPTKPGYVGTIYFRGFEKRFDKIRLSDDQEVLVTSYQDGPDLAVRITSIDAIELPKR